MYIHYGYSSCNDVIFTADVGIEQLHQYLDHHLAHIMTVYMYTIHCVCVWWCVCVCDIHVYVSEETTVISSISLVTH